MFIYAMGRYIMYRKEKEKNNNKITRHVFICKTCFPIQSFPDACADIIDFFSKSNLYFKIFQWINKQQIES